MSDEGWELHVEEHDILELLAHRWNAQARDLDPDWPEGYDESVWFDSQQHENQGHAAGLRQAAGELLTLINR